MPHAHARSEVGVGQPLGCADLQQSAYDRVRARVPARREHRHRSVFAGHGVQRPARRNDLRVDVEAVDRVDPQLQGPFGKLLRAAARGAEHRHLNVFQGLQRRHDRIFGQLGRHVRRVAPHDTRDFEIGSRLQRIQYIVSDISVTDDRSSDFFMAMMSLNVFRVQRKRIPQSSVPGS